MIINISITIIVIFGVIILYVVFCIIPDGFQRRESRQRFGKRRQLCIHNAITWALSQLNIQRRIKHAAACNPIRAKPEMKKEFARQYCVVSGLQRGYCSNATVRGDGKPCIVYVNAHQIDCSNVRDEGIRMLRMRLGGSDPRTRN